MPDWTEHLRPRLALLRLSASHEAEVIEEISQHLDQRYEELRADGASDADALRLAIEELRETDTLAEHMRTLRQSQVPPVVTPGVSTGSWLADLWQDLRYATRLVRKQPGFAAVAALTLGLGIGAITAIFSLINAAVLRALPFHEPERIVAIWAETPTGQQAGAPTLPPANADVAAWRAHTENFENIAAFSSGAADLTDRGDPERIGAAGVTAGFFETLGVTPLLGRTLAANEEVLGGPPVALISYGLWQRRFGGDPALVGKGIAINGSVRTVIGILPADFDFPRGSEWPAFFSFSGRTEVWLPLNMRPQDDGSGWSNWQSRHERGLIALGRVKAGVTVRQAQAEMDVFAAREARDHPDTHKEKTLRLMPLRDQIAGPLSRSLLTLFAAVGVLLLIACVNVANLLLARGVARRPEVALRAALGAGRGRLVRAMLTESLVLAVLATGIGLLIAEAALRVFLLLNPIGRSRLDDASLDLTAFAFAAVIAFATTIVMGLVPALHASRFEVRHTLEAAGRGGEAAVPQRIRGWLVATEVALAVILLTMAGLLVRSFLRVQAVDPGFRSDAVLAFVVQLPGSRYPNEASQIAFFDQLVERLEGLPTVRAAGAISYLPLGGGENNGSFVIEGAPPLIAGTEPKAERRWVTPGYFAAMGIPIRGGRVFTSRDTGDQPRVAVINQTLATQFFGAGDPLGRRLRLAGAWRTIIGVVADVKSRSLESDARPQVYVPYAQFPWGVMTVVVNTDQDPLALVAAARNELAGMDALLPAANMRTMKQVVSKASSARRFNVALLAFFAVTALLLTLMGIYGVVAFVVSRRSREIGIRIALGAGRIDILGLVLRQGMTPVALGAIGGLIGSVVGTRLIATQLYEVSPFDPLTFAGIIALLLTAALLACWLPARRAMKVHPTEALRST